MTPPVDLFGVAGDVVTADVIRAYERLDRHAGVLCRDLARTAFPGVPAADLPAAVGGLRLTAAADVACLLSVVERILEEDRDRPAGESEDRIRADGDEADDPMVRMLDRCWERVPDFIAGRRTGVDLVFPRGDRRLWADLQARSAHMRPYARVAADALGRLVRPGTTVLEVGAGSGAATGEFLARAGVTPPGRYVMSDVSPSFLRDARERFTAPWLEYAAFDFTRPAAAQELPERQFDVVVGTNALHCAADVDAALAHTWELVAPGGHLVLAEGARPVDGSAWRPELIFALLPGWWQVSLGARRGQVGFLTAPEWSAAVDGLPHARATVAPIGDHAAGTFVIGTLVIVSRTL